MIWGRCSCCGRRGSHRSRLLDLLHLLLKRRRVSPVRTILQNPDGHRQHEKDNGGVFCDLGQGVARARAEERVRGTATEGQTGARIFLRQLNQHEQNQHRAVDDQKKRQYSNEKTHIA